MPHESFTAGVCAAVMGRLIGAFLTIVKTRGVVPSCTAPQLRCIDRLAL
jgi:hypothetical protein